MTHRYRGRRHLGAMIAILLVGSSARASAETLLLMMESGPANKALVQSVAERLEAVGLQVQIASASLEDTAFLLGCEPEADACLELAAKAGGADAILILPASKGLLIAFRGKKRRSAQAPESAQDEAGWREALEKSLDVHFAPESATSNLSPDNDTEGGAEAELPDTTLAAEVATPTVSELAQESVLVQPASRPSASPLSRVKTRSWIVLGSGAALGGLGLVFLGVASSKQDQVNAHPIASAADFDALADLEASGENFILVGNLALVGGSLAMLAGVGMVVWDSKKSGEQQALTIAPSLSTQSVGLALSWGAP